MKNALIGCAIAKKSDSDLVRTTQFCSEGRTGRKRHGGADDAVRAEDIQIHIGNMHGAAEALAIAVFAPKQLRHHTAQICALGNAVAMATMITGDIIALIERSTDAGCDGLLADVAMRRPLDDTLFKQLVGHILEGADAPHCSINLEQYIRLQPEVGFTIHDSFRSCLSSKSLGRLSLFDNEGSGSSWIDVKPLVGDGSSGGFGWSVF